MTHPNTTGDDAMSETQFAKLFHIDGRQVLVYLCEGDEHDYDLHQIARTSFGMMDAKSSFNVSDDAPDGFDAFALTIERYTEDKARAFLDEVKRMEQSFSEDAA